MKRFDFKLQKLLEIRQRKEDLQKVKLARASGEYQYELSKVEKIKNNIKDYKKYLFKDKEKVSFADLRFLDQISTSSDEVIESMKPILEEKKKAMEAELQIFANLRKEKRVVELLKEKQYERYLKELDKEEQKNLDEVAKDVYLKNKGKPSTSEK